MMEKPVIQESSVPLDNTPKEILESKVSKLSPAVRKIAAEKNIDIAQDYCNSLLNLNFRCQIL